MLGGGHARRSYAQTRRSPTKTRRCCLAPETAAIGPFSRLFLAGWSLLAGDGVRQEAPPPMRGRIVMGARHPALRMREPVGAMV